MDAIGVRFSVSNQERFTILRSLFAEVKREKNAHDFRDPARWFDLVPGELRGNFEWPSDEERQAWLAIRDATPIRVDHPSEQLGGRWVFHRIFEALEEGEYSLVSCELVDDNIAEMQIDTWSYPYGGLGPMIALVEGFGFHILGVNECGRYESRAELKNL